ncbi:MAG: tripartite tricarboxylate transporter substrate binding protein [Burkholderiales bacterium]
MAGCMPIFTAIVTLALLVPCAWAQSKPDAQNYPVRPIRIIVPNPAAGPTDFTARAIAQRMTEAWGQQIIIDNRAGAGGIIAHEIAAKATPDGYTLIFSTAAGLIINPLLNKTSYDSFRDFAPISLGTVNPQMLFCNPGLPVANVKELIALAKAKPKQLNCASAGNGTPNHLGCELLKSMTGIDVVHVPYKGSPPAITDVISGQIQFMLNSIPTVLPLAKAGKIRALGVSGGKRSLAVPELPAIAETVPGFEYVQWFAMLAPARTPAAIVNKINAEMVKMIADPPFAQRLMNLGAEPQSSTPAELSAYMRTDSERWAGVITRLKAAGTKFEL